MADVLKCDAFGHLEIFRFVRLESIEFQRNSRLYKPLALVDKFRNFAFTDIPMLPVGVSGFCNKSKIVCAEP